MALIQAAIEVFLADHGGDSAGLADFVVGDLAAYGYVIAVEGREPPP